MSHITTLEMKLDATSSIKKVIDQASSHVDLLGQPSEFAEATQQGKQFSFLERSEDVRELVLESLEKTFRRLAEQFAYEFKPNSDKQAEILGVLKNDIFPQGVVVALTTDNELRFIDARGAIDSDRRQQGEQNKFDYVCNRIRTAWTIELLTIVYKINGYSAEISFEPSKNGINDRYDLEFLKV